MPAVWYKLLAEDGQTVIAEDELTQEVENVARLRQAVYNAERPNLPKEFAHSNLHVYPPNTTDFKQPPLSPRRKIDDVLKQNNDTIILVARPPHPISVTTPIATDIIMSPTWPEPIDSNLQYNIHNLVVGKSEFIDVRQSNGFLIDKSMLIHEFVGGDEVRTQEVCLILRPRRFGKTLNASMLCSFFGPRADHSLFRGLGIYNNQKFIAQHLGQYACIRISLLSCIATNWIEHNQQISNTIALVYKQHKQLILPYLVDEEQNRYVAILNEQSKEVDLQKSLLYLTQWYQDIYGRKSIVIMDEYDMGMQAAVHTVLRQRVGKHDEYNWNEYHRYADFYRTFLTNTFKDNANLYRAMLIGISRVARTGMLSGLNNLQVYNIQADIFSDKYGFTADEVRSIWGTFKLNEKNISLQNLQEMYNGYVGGIHQRLYNPWSIMSAVLRSDTTVAYWGMTGSLDLIRHVFMASSNAELRNRLSRLICGDTIDGIDIQHDTDYRQLVLQNEDAAWNLLFHAGYLTATLEQHHRDVTLNPRPLKLPNREVTLQFKQQLNQWYHEAQTHFDSTTILSILLKGDIVEFKTAFIQAFERCASYHDFTRESKENVYHVFALGVFVGALQRDYQCIESNRESGYGRFDLSIIPVSKAVGNLAVIIEFKSANRETELKDEATNALTQITQRKYNAQLPWWCDEVDHYGISFYRKSCYIAARKCKRHSTEVNQWDTIHTEA